MGLRIVVTVPRTYLVDQLNVGTPQDVEFYEECIAFAFTDRWDVEDLQFIYSDEATAHFFDCTSSSASLPCPEENDFTVALQEALERYKFTKMGDPGTFLRAGSTALEYLFPPLVTTQIVDPPEDEANRP